MMFCTKLFEGSSCRLIRLKAKARWLVSSGIIQQNSDNAYVGARLNPWKWQHVFTVAMRLKSCFVAKADRGQPSTDSLQTSHDR